ncbi:MAG: lysophospholipid acyltransferase family protein [candidate division KSB1 bacterium]|nr:lysophospholipid acyltransferase family protein [candidate division KSB1 bacterium]
MINRIRHDLEYAAAITIGFIVRLLPLRLALFVGNRLGDLVFYIIPIRRRVTLDNLKRAFPEKSGREIKRIARRVYQNLGKVTVEHLRFPGLTPEKVRQLVKFEDEELLQWARQQGKGAVLISGHFGNWELMGAAISVMGYPISFIVAEIHNKLLDNLINQYRQKMGATIIPKGIAVRGVLRALRHNEFVAILIDQDAGKDGVFVDFLGQPASAPRGPALFVLKTGAPLIFGTALRQKNGTLRVIFEKMPCDHLREVTEENIAQITQTITHHLETYVRQYPDHWFWMHRRWKSKPPEN